MKIRSTGYYSIHSSPGDIIIFNIHTRTSEFLAAFGKQCFMHFNSPSLEELDNIRKAIYHEPHLFYHFSELYYFKSFQMPITSIADFWVKWEQFIKLKMFN